jgi:hypothetical protein
MAHRTLRWSITIINLILGIAALFWAIQIHLHVFGSNRFFEGESTQLVIVFLLLLTLVAVVLPLIWNTEKKSFSKFTNWMQERAGSIFAYLLIPFVFLLLFLVFPGSLGVYAKTIRSLALPLGVYTAFLILVFLAALISYATPTNLVVADPSGNTLSVSKPILRKSLVIIFIGLLEINCLASIFMFFGNPAHLIQEFMNRLLVENETSIYTWFSSLMLTLVAVNAAMLCVSSNHSKPGKWLWGLISVAFLIMAVDEVAALHELAIHALRLDGIEVYGSSLIYLVPIVFILGFGVWWLLRLAKKNKVRQLWQFILGIMIYFAGALLVEAIHENIEILYGEGQIPFLVTKSMLLVEEAMELGGTLVIFFFTLAQPQFSDLRIRYSPEQRALSEE